MFRIFGMYVGTTIGAVLGCVSHGLSIKDACFVGITTPLLILTSRITRTPISIQYGTNVIFTDYK